MTDLHMHTFFSHDGRESAENYVIRAIETGKKRIGFSEHYDYDCFVNGDGTSLCSLSDYRREIERLKEKYAGKIEILFGIEFGYDEKAVEHYRKLISDYNFDYVINSVHLVGKRDCYFNEYCQSRTKRQAYTMYLEKVLESVRVDYPYQIVGHIGYPVRYAPFEDKKMPYEEYADLFDEILKEIISRGVFLELNTSTKGVTEFLPDKDVVKRYIELGGKKFTYGSDAHDLKRFYEKEENVKTFLKERGMKGTYFINGKACKEEF